MKVALIGYGRMGRLLEAQCRERGHQVAAVVDPLAGTAGFAGLAPGRAPAFATIAEGAQGLASGRAPGRAQGLAPGLREADLALEFSRPDTAAENLLALAGLGLPVVCGTTGWYDRLPEVAAAVEAAGTSLVWASNFSLGVNLFYRIAEAAALIMDPFPEYDLGGWEAHHHNKADSPSGTARALVERVLSRMSRKTQAVYDKLDRPPAPQELHYASLRLGSEPGLHSLIFDSAADTIELSHRARNREGLAAGALRAAEWLARRQGAGVFTMDDVLEDLLGSG
ncbi:MAG: 4-hydroxy-tetrahydrodipicolinate reductase [Treponema sp.]|jgi:4-hydroxy-tetrahydrodipicolinate reductase|nr:4-hydroxy-tetrahydrodipicolinate reductase [Treponema sp.]